eukprot:1324339-Rhodomonas_salina.1
MRKDVTQAFNHPPPPPALQHEELGSTGDALSSAITTLPGMTTVDPVGGCADKLPRASFYDVSNHDPAFPALLRKGKHKAFKGDGTGWLTIA